MQTGIVTTSIIKNQAINIIGKIEVQAIQIPRILGY